MNKHDNDIATTLHCVIAGQTPPTTQWVEQMEQDYPFFTLPRLLLLRHGAPDPDGHLLQRLAIASPDRRDLALSVDLHDTVLAAFYPPAPPATTPDTDTTIDSFLDTYGSSSERELEVINNAIFNPMPDYADILAAQEQQENPARAVAAQTREDQLINDFIEQSKLMEQASATSPQQMHVAAVEVAAVQAVPIEQPVDNNDSMLSESLAKMYIQQGKYSKALEIIENINLKFPEKSIYFADQIRFLRKLVLNDKLLNKK